MQLTSVDPWWDWSLANTSSVLQTLLTAAGFSLAIFQLWRTANATEKSNTLLEKMRTRLIGNDLLVILPDLHAAEDNLDDALRADDSEKVERALVAYSRKSSEVIGLLESNDAVEGDKLIKLLKSASRECTKSKGEVAENTDQGLRLLTASAQKKVAAANHEATVVRSRLHRKGD